MNKYRTTQGDTWDMISFKVYKSEKYMHLLIDANPKYRSIVVFPANYELNIPIVSMDEKVSFPPWRRNA